MIIKTLGYIYKVYYGCQCLKTVYEMDADLDSCRNGQGTGAAHVGKGGWGGHRGWGHSDCCSTMSIGIVSGS